MHKSNVLQTNNKYHCLNPKPTNHANFRGENNRVISSANPTIYFVTFTKLVNEINDSAICERHGTKKLLKNIRCSLPLKLQHRWKSAVSGKNIFTFADGLVHFCENIKYGSSMLMKEEEKTALNVKIEKLLSLFS